MSPPRGPTPTARFLRTGKFPHWQVSRASLGACGECARADHSRVWRMRACDSHTERDSHAVARPASRSADRGPFWQGRSSDSDERGHGGACGSTPRSEPYQRSAGILHARAHPPRTRAICTRALSTRAAPRPSPPHHAVESCPQRRSDCAMRMQTSAWPVASASRATQSNQLHHAVGTCARTERPCTHRLQRSDLRPPTGSRTSDRLDDEPT